MDRNKKEEEEIIYSLLGVGPDIPVERPAVDNLYLFFWRSANIAVKWPRGISAKEALIQWAVDEIRREENGS